MTRTELFKQVGVKDEAEFYERYPDEKSFTDAHPDIPVMGLGGILKGIGNVAKAVLPTALSFIPGVGGIAGQAAGALLGGMGGGTGGGQKKGGFGKILGAGLNILGGVMDSGLLKSKDGVPGQVPMMLNQGAQMVNNAQMNNLAREKFLSGLQPNSRALMDQFGDDEQPILFKYGGGTVEDADIVPQRMRRSGMVNAEVEEGEVVEDQDGNVEYVNPNDPHAGEHGAEGGALMSDAQRVLEDTSNKKGRNSWKDKTLRLSPEKAESLTGVKFKRSTSHAGALMAADEHYGKQRSKYTKAIDKVNKMRVPDTLSMNSAKMNLKIGMQLPAKEDLFDTLFEHQEDVKYSTGIDSGEEMQYGGIAEYRQGGEEPKKKKDTRPKVGFKWVDPNSTDRRYETGAQSRQRQTVKVLPGLKRGEAMSPSDIILPPDTYGLPNRPAPSFEPGVAPKSGNWDPMRGITEETLAKVNTKTMPTITITGKKKPLEGTVYLPADTKRPKTGGGSAGSGSAASPLKISIPDLSAGENEQSVNKFTTFGSMITDSVNKAQGQLRDATGITAGENSYRGDDGGQTQYGRSQAGQAWQDEPMDALDYKPLADAMMLRKAPVRFTPIDLERMKMKRISARSMIDQINSDYRSALMATNGDAGAVSSLLARKYDATNQAFGNVQNANNQIFNQEEAANTDILNKEAIFKNQNLDQFDTKIATRDANYSGLRNEMLNSFYSNVRANRQFNRNAKLMVEFAGRGMYDKDGNFIPGSGAGDLSGGSPNSGNWSSKREIEYNYTQDGKFRPTAITTKKNPGRGKYGGKLKFK